MSEPLVLVVLLGAAPDPTAETMLATARQAMGPDAIVLADTSETRTDEAALAIAERVHARAVARVSWPDGALTVARLHVHVGSGEWTDEEISFSTHDAPAEKGRALGFTLASMVHRLEREHPLEPEPAPPAEPPAPPIADEPAPSVGAPRSDRRRDVDVFVNAIGALDPVTGALGVAGGARYFPSAHVGLRVAAGARTGDVSSADAATSSLLAAGGLAYRTAVGAAVEVGARADLVVMRHSVTRSNLTRGRWLGATHIVLEGGVGLGYGFAVVAGVGAEVAFGATTVDVGGAPVAEIPPVRAIAELGARFRW